MADVVMDGPLEHVTFEFPLTNQERATALKNIPPSTLPIFYGLVIKDLDTFLFDFDVLCRSYDYTTNAHMIKLFPTTLKDVALRWFMGLGRDVLDWNTMKKKFLEKYQDYCRGINRRRDDIFKMSQK